MTTLMETEDEVMLRDAARGFVAESAPVAKLRENRKAGRAFDPGLWREMAQMGWSGVLVPEVCGGAEMGHRAACILAEEMGRTLAASPFLSTAVVAASTLRAVATDRAGTALGQIAAGDVIYALALDEGRKYAPESTAMQAERAGNGFRLTGVKPLVADGSAADRVLVLARTAGAPGDAVGLTLFDIDAARAGLTRDRLDTIDSRDHARLIFDAVEATGDDVLGEVDNGLAVLRAGVQAGQAAMAAELLGVAGGAYGMTVGYLKERRQFDRTIGSFQALQHRAAHLWAEIEVTASAIANAGRVLDKTPQDAQLAVSLAKARAAQTVDLAVREGVQMHGGIGMTDDYDIGFYMKRARVGAEWLGDYGYHAALVAAARGF
ncbi:acyl-CoA/acyl-ACP dehydrogenase [Lutimaribacter sp. EGI FJ00015]|uniref:Acyl-CoA/acyl-ACP dehydrogenase n=1 Tax=Lutimaribacter degradans TaxID=2945989 RepID=A0ACC5ZYU0_9RHOB|nr:acyl-CoA dehydrogenase family protein [Lutimaribacter sp. EGI FJ00013]MCM2562529.1 acyl-CoA/acyl-ACP dehydrogenase [Lutimaribacter sp. EGI FJ00013]MCO0613686.1 acyl-CoA/acyl-ACP dehydrogenase [Lutimaribacter sp. EGI FJ00015]MCO0636831.1 acyl-CoA/acyl-ACP dehydrogenase [Lutimaribacter sp. EGI FJ00014]